MSMRTKQNLFMTVLILSFYKSWLTKVHKYQQISTDLWKFSTKQANKSPKNGT